MNTTRFFAAALASGLLTVAQAGDRRFVYNYDTETAPAGSWEYEQWVTWKHYTDKDRLDVRHEVEYGITDRLQVGLYLADWRYEKVKGAGSETDYRASGVEVIYQLSDPNKAAFGSAIYGEVLIGDEQVKLEPKLLLQKNFGPFIAVYNLVLEAEWEGEDLRNLDEKVGVWENTFGLSYQVNPRLFVGVEALHEQEFADWSDAGEHVVYAGPNLSCRHGAFFATVAGLLQATDVDGEPESQVRIIAGAGF